MATGSSISAQLGLKAESTWGTAVVVDRFYELISESLDYDVERLESEAIRASTRVQRSDDWTAGSKTVSGNIELDLSTKNWALLFGHMLGTTVTTGTGPYTHTITPGDLTGKGLTIQVGRPSTDGTVQPFTFNGCKIAGWELSSEVGGLGRVSLDVVGKDMTTATSLATASYTASNSLLSFVHGAVSLAGSSAKVRSMTISGDNALEAERFFIGQDTTSEPLEAGYRQYTGTLEMDFESLTAYDRFRNGTEGAFSAVFTRSTDSITIAGNVRFDGPSTPNVDGQGILGISMPIKFLGSSTDASALTVTVVSGEATP